MDASRHREQYVGELADEILVRFSEIAKEARSRLSEDRPLGSESLASINTLTSTAAIQNLSKVTQAQRETHRKLADEPAIARIVVTDESGERQTHYICRSDQGMQTHGVVSYKAPMGRIAALPIGDTWCLPNGRFVEVVERANLRPENRADGWDSRDSILENERIGPITVESLRALISEIVGEAQVDDILSQILADDGLNANIIDGVRRSVITKMGLRDQPILDQYQDEIFRLPLDRRLLILGPPGTGKTTTLIRRLGQKIDTAYLEEGERNLVESLSSTQGLAHAHSWLMFTPTELLKQYLKEAFAREDVPAPDSQISTWHDYRRELARNALGILRTSTGGGVFVLQDGLNSLSADAGQRPIQWFDDFDRWQRTAFVSDLREAVQALNEASLPSVQALGARINQVLERAAADSLPAMFGALAQEVVKVQSLVAEQKEASDKKIKECLNLQLNRNRNFLTELSRFIDGLQQAQASEPDDQDDLEIEDAEESATPRTPISVALNAYMQAVRAQARAVAAKRAVSKTSRNGKILEWLGERTLAEADRLGVGTSVSLQIGARRFVNPIKRYFGDLPKRYRAFRRVRQEEGKWFAKEGFESRDIHPLELDLVVLAILRAAGDLLGRAAVQRDIDAPAWSSLKRYLALYRNQILIDEATDFSPIQLACMASLTHPKLRSLFACGDFNQRLTTWGTRSEEEIKWVSAEIEIREITIAYRQSDLLNDFARALIRAVGGTEQTISLPARVENRGVAPALLEFASDSAQRVAWLAGRIRDIECFLRQLPSVAVFVNTEAEVDPLAQALQAALADHNIPVMACHDGQAVGQESCVRVFDIQHIKGLEFEAVFFIGIDRLASLHPQLFDKYLYVGTTRAATYLGVTCDDALPAAISTLRPMFVANWMAP